jgi:hypothetical protein
MSMKKVLLASVLGGAFALSAVVPAVAQAIEGKVTAVEGEGRTVMIGDKKVAVSNSGTKVTINGAAGARGDIKAGMTCKADGEAAKMLDCK